MDSEYAALLAAVLAAPEDDAPRLILADWLDEHPTPENVARAAIIRVGCELARLGGWGSCKNNRRRLATVGCGRCDVCRLCKRLDGITGRIGPGPMRWVWPKDRWCWTWIADERDSPTATEFTITRGFASRVRTDSHWFLAHGPALVRAHPVERVLLNDKEPWQLPLGMSHRGRDYRRTGRERSFQFFRAGRTPPPALAADYLPDELWRQRKAEGWSFGSESDALDALSAAALAWAKDPDPRPARRLRPSRPPRAETADGHVTGAAGG